ncbi:glycoside hydrolase [Tothia fuscella]|uniref:Glycoside hydrolase n=1 Tax=Tothia fuscella TaxID=1048955 RepID=A0A9P4P579_9PEZI|nr:glycoside hydrolase [Tothia fuscella]
MDNTVQFTLKFRPNRDSPWKWARDQFSLGDGSLYYQPAIFSEHELPHFFADTSSMFEIQQLSAETPKTQLWSLTAPVQAASGDQSGNSTHILGLPTNFTRFFALVRLWSPWLAPRHGQKKFSIDKDAIMVAFLRHDGMHVVALAVSGVDDVMSTFIHDKHGNVVVQARNDGEAEGVTRVIVAVANSFDVANGAVMYQARRTVMSFAQASGELQAEMDALEKSDIKPQWLEGWSDGLAYCTWNGLGQDLTEDKIFDALASLKKNDIIVSNLIIDDNWQSLDNEGQNQNFRGMTDFEANKKGFPNGMKSTIEKIREENPNMQHIAVWHALLGYWGAISPNGQLAEDYKTVKVNGPNWTCIDPDDIDRWYTDFYNFLQFCGIDSVKTDAQFMLDQLQSAKDRRRMIRSYQDAWSIANLRYLGARAISCMSQTPQILFHSQLPTNKPQLCVRNSDDFFPEIESSHPWHVFCNAANSHFSRHCNVLPDWDMFQTSHAWAHFHAAARCVSGGPIYITDTPGKHDVPLIRQMTAKTPRGNTVILRPPHVGKSSNPYTAYDEEKLLKIDTYVGMAKTGTGILGIFNVSQHPLTEIVLLDDFPGTEEGEYVIRSHVGERTSKPSTRKDGKAIITESLGIKGYDILSAYAVRRYPRDGNEIAVANLGLLGKMSGAAAVVNTIISVEKNGRLKVWTSLKALGIYGLWISDLASRSIETDLMGLMFGKPIPLDCVRKSDTDPNVLEIDLESAWKESDQKAGWSNEVAVEIFIQ